MIAVLRRVRVFAGQLGLLAALSLVAALLVTAAPRVANELSDQALREDVERLPYSARDITFERQPVAQYAEGEVRNGLGSVDPYRHGMREPLPGLVQDGWFTAAVAGRTMAPTGPRTTFGLRAQSGLQEAVRVTAGRWPRNEPAARPVEIAVSTAVAKQMELALGTTLAIRPTSQVPVQVQVVVTGIYEPVDPSAHRWEGMRLALEPFPGLPPDVPASVLAVTDPQGITAAGVGLSSLTLSWRYRIDAQRLDAGMVEPIATALAGTKRTPPGGGLVMSTALDDTLLRFQGQLRAVQALLAVVQAGLVATLLGLIALAAALAVERRREEFALLRARGSAITAIAGRSLAESLVVLPAATLAGWAIGTYAPGRPADTVWLVVTAGAAATLAVPVLAAATQRRLAFTARRQDLVRHRPSRRRLTAELFFLVVAGLGAYLLRRRGLSTDAGVDPYLASVPVLLAVGAAIVALRLFPWPLRQVSRLASRARGAVAFLGLARAGRGAPVTIGPLAVLVVAIATGIFSSVVMTSVAEARDRASDIAVPADARLSGPGLTSATADRIAGLPGVTAVARYADDPATMVNSDAGGIGQARVLIVDVAALARVVADSGVDVRLPAALVDAKPGSGPVPALVSPALAAEVGSGGVATMNSRPYEFSVAAVADIFPGLGASSLGRFIVLPWQALPAPEVIAPSALLIAGDGFDPLKLQAAAGPETTVTTWAAHRQTLDRTGANEVLTFTFTTGAAGATVLALLAVGFAVLAGARVRGQVLSRLRTLGLSGRQGRGLLVYELVPLVGIAVVAGGLVGVFLPRLLGPALGLSSFTSGAAVRTYLDPILVGAVLMLVVAALIAAMLVENVINRRLRLGEVLRVGEEGR
ncbi:ABC transporter permease [Phytohabitans rumicis]|uniref:Membrane protein n=1 Tax=Phytohabitans rumicis TaxID=1076125 RepID=A0A6V8L8E6_9ACTN|nr:ABC transporter permease [Phytohabitans rumicis]GFJ90386.1 membrane protein [Phytohabitans rumicis]